MDARLSQQSIPMVVDFGKAFQSNDLVTAVGDPDSRVHGANESVHLSDFAPSCLAEILMLNAICSARPGRLIVISASPQTRMPLRCLSQARSPRAFRN
jgi:hypothetical protein